MKLEYNQDYLSITEFGSVQLPNFTVLTGVNGSGKSHLLKAIQAGNVLVEGDKISRIVHFNYETFKLENEQSISVQQIIDEKKGVWNFLHNGQAVVIIPNIQNFKNALGDSYGLLIKACKEKKKPLWALVESDIEDPQIYKDLCDYRDKVSNHFETQKNLRTNKQALAIFALLKKLDCSLDELSENDFRIRFEPYTLKEGFLPTELGKVFTDYYAKYEQNLYAGFRNSRSGENNEVLSEKEFVKLHGPKPWRVVNDLLRTFNSLPYSINSPEGLDRDDTFQAKLLHNDRPEVSPLFSELSSGERILLALVASIFKPSSDGHFPDLLLLDEVDASLHPSMMQNLLDVIHNVFLRNDVKVILVTHSPTTIALSPEKSIYVMNRSGKNRIEKKSKSEALDILTEGFATLEMGLRLFDEVARSNLAILTEGNNTVYIEKALEFFGIKNVEVITGVEDRSGKAQLRTLYDFFSRLPHDHEVIIVWDCDAHTYRNLESTSKTTPFVFDRNENNAVCKKGIENLFAEGLFENFNKTITGSLGDVTKVFDNSRKVDFEQFVMQRNCKSDFGLFEPLIELIRKLKRK